MSSRSLLGVVLLAVVAGVVFLLFGNPFGAQGDAHDAPHVEAEAPSAVGAGAMDEAPAATRSVQDPALAGGYDAVGRGDVTARLLSFRDRKPLVGQPVRMTLRGGDLTERKTGEDGRVWFRGIRAAKAWTLAIEGAGFSPIEMKNVAAPANGVNDLGDLLLGDKVVLKGRVIDARGKPIPGAAVSAYVGGGIDFSQGLALSMAATALETPLATDQAETDTQGQFTLGALTPGRAYQVKTKHPGYAMNVQTDLVVTPDRGGSVLTIMLGEGATVRGKVVDENGRAIDKATVIAMEDFGMGMRAMGGSMTLKRDYATSKPDGTYVLDTLTRGARYRFGVAAPGYAPLFDTMAGGMTVEGEVVRDFTVVKGGSIEGRVVDKATGQGIADARVLAIVGNLMRFGGAGGRRAGMGPGGAPGGAAAPSANPSEDEASTQITRTGADGSFRIDGLKPGPVGVGQVKASGYADYAATAFGAMIPGSPAMWGEVKAGETLSVTVELEAGGSISGRVAAATPNGTAPVAGAQVSVIQLSMAAMWTGFATATTGEDGSFKVDGIKPGRYTVTATASGLVAPDAMAADAAVEMPAGGGIVTKDVLMSAAGAIEGTVRDTKGAPVGGARVRTRVAPERGGAGRFTGGMLRGALPGGGAKVVLTDGEGRYRIDTVAAGEKTIVTADSDEYVPTESDPIEARVGETRTVDLVISGGGTLKGRAVDDQGAVVPGARLRVGHLDADTDANPTLNAWRAHALLDPRVVFADAEGYFEITRIQPGRTLVKGEKEGYTAFYRRDVVIRADEVNDNYMVRLVKGQTIGGVVRGEDGKPVAGAMVAATKQTNPQRGFGGGGQTPANGETQSDGTVEPQMMDRTDAEGRFTIEGIPPGTTYSVVVWFAQGYRGYAQGDDAAIKRGVDTGARDVELVLKKLPEGESPFGPMPRPPQGTPGATGTVPTPGMGGGRMPIPPTPAMGG